jgi:hypothetical protein
MKHRWAMLGYTLVVALVTGCTPGYIKSNELESKGQGPSACSKACEDIGMRMTAMVLVGDTVPGCVCQPVTLAPAGSSPAPTPPATDGAPQEGAAASSGGYVLIAAAAAARQQQEQQRRQQQQQQKH